MNDATCRVVALRASAGQFVFDESMDASERETLREMWANRLAGFRRFDLDQYLRDTTETTRYVIGGRTSTAAAYRRMCRVLFPLQRVGARFGVTLTAEALDPCVLRHGNLLVTDCCLVLMLADRIVYQSRLTMTIAVDRGRCVWADVRVDRIPRRCWPYAYRRDEAGRSLFVARTGWAAPRRLPPESRVNERACAP